MPGDFVLGVVADLNHVFGHAAFADLDGAGPGAALGLGRE